VIYCGYGELVDHGLGEWATWWWPWGCALMKEQNNTIKELTRPDTTLSVTKHLHLQ